MKRITLYTTENFNPVGPGTELVVDEDTYQYEIIDELRSYFATADRMNTKYKSVGIPTTSLVVAIVHNDQGGSFQKELDNWIKVQYREYKVGN